MDRTSSVRVTALSRLLLAVLLSSLIASPVTVPAIDAAPAPTAQILDPATPLTPQTTAHTLNLSGGGYLQIDHAPELNPPGGFTVEAWVWRRDATRCETVFSKNMISGLWVGMCSKTLRVYTHGAGTARDGTIPIPAGVWTHIAAAFDGVTRRYYVNGLLDLEAATPGPLPNNADPAAIGADSNGVLPFSGNLAEVRYWRVARSQTEIRRDMVRQMDGIQPDLIGLWRLDGGSAEAYGAFATTEIGPVTFDGPAALPVDHDPIRVHRSDLLLDGNCAAGEYGLPTLPIWYVTTGGARRLGWVYAAVNARDVFVCFKEIDLEFPFVGLYLDADGSGGSLPGPGEYQLALYRNQTFNNRHGIGGAGYADPGLSGVATAVGGTEFDWNAEYRIPRTVLAGTFRMQFMYHWRGGASGVDFGWPVDYHWLHPNVWPTFRIDDTWPRSDMQNPGVSASHTPTPANAGDAVTITASAWDDRDLAQVDIYLDGVLKKVCSFPGAEDRSADCATDPQALSIGRHYYYARATDHRGRLGFTSMQAFPVTLDGAAPVISASYAPRRPARAQTVTVAAVARDPSGIERIKLFFDVAPFEYTCTYAPGVTEAECHYALVAPPDRSIASYSVLAEDNEGLLATRPRVAILYGNTGTDTDGDGLDDAHEDLLHTDRYSVDTDMDMLPDDWEVLGYGSEAPGTGWWVDLPGMGADPRAKDIFLQVDYERGARPQPTVFPYIFNMFREHGITFHLVGETERPRPAYGPVSDEGAERSAARVDGTGHYWFDPKLTWAVHYGYVQHSWRASYDWYFVTININTNNCPLSTADPQNDPACGPRNMMGEVYALVHELGHNMGLGHGGRLGSNNLIGLGEAIWREGDWDNGNQKANYISVMNYLYSAAHLCYNPTDNSRTSAPSFLGSTMPTLNETALSESADNPMSVSLRAQPCPAGSVPVMLYGCVDDVGTHWMVMHDGTQMRGRAIKVDDGAGHWWLVWQYTGLPAIADGVDWDCDGVISTGAVQANINGDGGDIFKDGVSTNALVAREEWSKLPFQAGAGCFLIKDDNEHISDAYIAAVGGAGCTFGGATGAGDDAAAIPLNAAGDPAPAYTSPVPTDPHEDTFTLPPVLVGTEQCNGLDDDGDRLVDEGCADRDKDQVADAIDNCPLTWNPDQIDAMGNLLGDACRTPQVTGLSAKALGDGAVALSWRADSADVLGFAVYRAKAGGDLALLGGYPTTTGTSFVDKSGGSLRYCVRAINRLGDETGEQCVQLGGAEKRVWLPLVLR